MATARGILKSGLLEWKKEAKVRHLNLLFNKDLNSGKSVALKMWKTHQNFTVN